MQESFKINFHQRAPWSKKTTKTIGNWKHISRITCHVFFSWSNLKTLNIISLLLINYLSKIAVVKKKSKTDCDRKRRWHYLSIGSTHDILGVRSTYFIKYLLGILMMMIFMLAQWVWWRNIFKIMNDEPSKHKRRKIFQTTEHFGWSSTNVAQFLDDKAQNNNLNF